MLSYLEVQAKLAKAVAESVADTGVLILSKDHNLRNNLLEAVDEVIVGALGNGAQCKETGVTVLPLLVLEHLDDHRKSDREDVLT